LAGKQKCAAFPLDTETVFIDETILGNLKSCEMKQILFLAILFLFSQTVFAQTKVVEYYRTDSDSEASRLDDYLVKLQKEPESKGLIVIYSGKDGRSLGNALQDIEGIKAFVNIRSGKSYSDRISFKIIEEAPPLFKEFWVYPKGLLLPKTELKSVNLDNLKTNYLYASVCAGCDPAVPSLSRDFVNLELYANLLKRYPNYSGLIIINLGSYEGWSRNELHQDALNYGINYRNSLVKDYKTSNKISLKVSKPLIKKNSPVWAKFYIVPKK
jgi:hypothetical protein